METWFIIIVTLCITFFLKSLFNLIFSPSSNRKNKKALPPGPYSVPVIGSLLWATRSFADLEPILRDLKAKYGPLITLNIGSRSAIFVASHSLAHQALVQQGAVFSDRPRALPTSAVVSSNQRNISSAPYGPIWRLLRRNLTSEILHPSRVKSYSKARSWVLGILLQQLLHAQVDAASEVKLIDHFQYAMFCLLVLMCFGDKLDEPQIKQIEDVQRRLLLGFRRFNILNFFPRVGKYIFQSRWNELFELRHEQEKIFVPLIESRSRGKEQKSEEEGVVAYVDTLLNLELPEENRKLNHSEMVSLCSEFLSAGTDTTSTALQWIMANLVINPSIQEKLYQEVAGVVSEKERKLTEEAVKEEDLNKMPYLKAVILEGLRRHPPGHFVLPHTVTEDVELNGYVVPKTATINFMVAEMGLDPTVWEDPLEFRPERFLVDGDKEGFDITGSREIKMMPFGAGRRICPGYLLAMLHLEYFVANLIWHFEWKAVDGDDVDLSEKLEFTVVMKNPLRACICPRVSSV